MGMMGVWRRGVLVWVDRWFGGLDIFLGLLMLDWLRAGVVSGLGRWVLLRGIGCGVALLS